VDTRSSLTSPWTSNNTVATTASATSVTNSGVSTTGQQYFRVFLKALVQ